MITGGGQGLSTPWPGSDHTEPAPGQALRSRVNAPTWAGEALRWTGHGPEWPNVPRLRWEAWRAVGSLGIRAGKQRLRWRLASSPSTSPPVGLAPGRYCRSPRPSQPQRVAQRPLGPALCRTLSRSAGALWAHLEPSGEAPQLRSLLLNGHRTSGPRLPAPVSGYEATGCSQGWQGPEPWGRCRGRAGTRPPTPARPPDSSPDSPLSGSLRWASATQGGSKLAAGPFMGEQRLPSHKGVTMSVKKEAAGLRQFIPTPLIQFRHN